MDARAGDRTGHHRTTRKTRARRASPAPGRRRVLPGVPSGSVPGARPGPLPEFLAPQLAALVAAPPAGDEWLHEMKFDGYRILCRIEQGRATLLSRNAKDWTDRFPDVAAAATALPARQAFLDGEIAVLLPNGTTSFQALQNAGTGQGQLCYFVFDLMHLDGQDLMGATLEVRKRALEALVGSRADGVIRYSTHVVGRGEEFFRQACRLSLEGIVAKRRDGPYRSGRGRSWLKVKCIREQEFVIGGFTEPKGSRTGLGALLLGVHGEDGALAYAGKVGTGFTAPVATSLRKRLDELRVTESPFPGHPPGGKEARWVKPTMVAEVGFTEWTDDGRLRHPSFKGIREDKTASEVVRERPATTAPTAPASPRASHASPRARSSQSQDTAATKNGDAVVSGVRISHPDRVVYPEDGVTKAAVARYYAAIADHMLPHLRSRPVALLRCPDGLGGQCFYQKHPGSWAPSSLRRVRIREKAKSDDYLVIEDAAGLVALIQMGVLEIHTWNAQAGRLEAPDRVIFDLDPGPDVPWEAVVTAARLVRARLEGQGLRSFVKTTGGKGLHVVAPIKPGPGWSDCVAFARRVVDLLVAETPKAFVATMAKSARKGKIFIDYFRNQRGATSVAAFSTRARAGAPVSTPITWDELSRVTSGSYFTLATIERRLAKLSRDPWAGYATLAQPLPAVGRVAT